MRPNRDTIQKWVTLFLYLILVAIPCMLLSCTWGDSGPAPVLTVVKPAIISTYPSDGATGPLNLYTPRPDTVKPHFTVHFNKSMNLATLNAATVTCTGFHEPVNAQVLYRTGTNGDVIAFQVVRRNSGPSNGKPLRYDVNATYTVTIDPSVADDHGNLLGKEYVFSFKPEPYFRVVGFSFHDGDTIIPASIGLYFNSKLSSAAIGAITVLPPIGNPLSIDSTTDSTSIRLDSYLATTPGVSYAVGVDAGAHDTFGNSIHIGETKSFFVPAIAVSRNIFSLQNVNLSSQIRLSFNYPMIITSIDSAFSFSPPTALITATGETQLSLYAASDFQPNSDYTIQLSTALRTVNGFHIPAPIIIPFHTAVFAVTHLPANGETNVSTHDVIEFDFTGAVDTSTVASSVTVTPQVNHHWTFDAGTTPGKFIYAYFVPTGIFSSRTRYQVVVSNAITSVAGFAIAQPDTFLFVTGN